MGREVKLRVSLRVGATLSAISRPIDRAREGSSSGRHWYLGAIAALSALLLVVLACGQAGPTATSTPTSTAAPASTAIPTPTPTPAPTSTPRPTPQLVTRDSVIGLMDMVPAEYNTVIFADIRAILQDAGLRQALDDLGLLAALGPAGDAIQSQADVLVLARRGSRALGILRGPLDRQKLVDSLTDPQSEVESESYGAFEILKLRISLPFFTMIVPIAFLDETTGVFAISLSPEHSSEAELKAVLDHVGESKPGFLADTAILELFQRIPTGVAMVVDSGCQALGRYEGCQRTAASAVPEADYGVVHWVFEFSTSEAAQAALPTIRQGISGLQGPLSAERVIEGSQRGNTVEIRSTVDISEALSGAIGAAVP